ncbi:MAG TPA: divergent polysaccharide deacetylase family protein [Xanthobacteraceae bacterium]|nr:divergent polysaccharide deacetylase family protein [Xanthobacteraceae bacterium]
MADDDLSAPLARKKPKRKRMAPPVSASQALAGALALFVGTWVVWALVANNPLGGEPVAVVATNLAADAPGSATAKPTGPVAVVVADRAGQTARRYDGPDGTAATPPAAQADTGSASGPNTVTIIDGSTGKRQVVALPSSPDARAPVEQRALERSSYGAIPRIAPDGARPAEIYGRRVDIPAARKNNPRITIIVGGLGISANLTQQAIKSLPAPIAFAFSPYGADLERTVTQARAEGHEALLQVPMEPLDFPDNDPGPHALLTSLSAPQNLDRLHWLMSRFQGYVGIVNTMGARFTASAPALTPVLNDIAARGLIYIDNGSSAKSLAGQIAGAGGLPFARADVVLDAMPAAAQIDAALARLETLARERGAAVGIASALPASVERIAQWAKAAEARGFVLVPVTAAAIKPKSS